MMNPLFLFLLLFLAGCGPSSLEDFQVEGEARIRSLLGTLKPIETRAELVTALPSIKKNLSSLVDLIIAARQFQREHPEDDNSKSVVEEPIYSDLLKEELKRIYALEGGREILESAEREALFRLDAFEKSLIETRIK